MTRVPAMTCIPHRVPECQQCKERTMPGKCEHGLTTAECLVCASPKHGERADAYRCIAPACKPLGCSDCNCAVPADVYVALGRAFADAERERCAKVLRDMWDEREASHGNRAGPYHEGWTDALDIAERRLLLGPNV